MEKQLQFLVSLGLWFLLVLHVHAQVKLYFKLGSSVKIDPNVMKGQPINSIEWKFNTDVVAEYVKDKVPLGYYDPFDKGRSQLDLTTAVFTINNMEKSLEGEYTAEVFTPKMFILRVKFNVTELKELPKPETWVQPVPCSIDHSSCTMVCEVNSGSDPNFGPITYRWKEDSGEWKEGERTLEFFRVNTSAVKTFSCQARNPVSVVESDTEDNPFYSPPHSRTGGIVGGVIGGLFALIVGMVVFFKREQIMELIVKRSGGTGPATLEEVKSLNEDNSGDNPTGDPKDAVSPSTGNADGKETANKENGGEKAPANPKDAVSPSTGNAEGKETVNKENGGEKASANSKDAVSPSTGNAEGKETVNKDNGGEKASADPKDAVSPSTGNADGKETVNKENGGENASASST